MAERTRISSMWRGRSHPEHQSLLVVLKQALDRALDRCVVAEPVVWFRADDVGIPSANLFALLDCFRRHDVPLALAVVPSWLSASRWHVVQAHALQGGRWCFHQHGRRHVNHQPSGRKSEFGTARSQEALLSDVLQGKQRLERLLQEAFFPVFTPPWNRMDGRMGNILQSLGFQAASRNDKAFFQEPLDFFEVPVNCDLHTRSGTALETWADFYGEFQWWIAQGLLGVMLHHQRMNRCALEFLDILLKVLCAEPRIRLAGLDELVLEQRTVPEGLVSTSV